MTESAGLHLATSVLGLDTKLTSLVAGSTIALNEPKILHFVVGGSVDLFLTASDLSRPIAWFRIGRVGPGALLPGVLPSSESMLIARPAPGAEIVAVTQDVIETADQNQVARAVDNFLLVVGSRLSNQLRPREAMLIDEPVTVMDGTGHGFISTEVRWLLSIAGESTVNRWNLTTPLESPMWITQSDWVTASTDCEIRTTATAGLGQEMLNAVRVDLQRWVDAAITSRTNLEQAETDRTRKRADDDEAMEHKGELALALVLADSQSRRDPFTNSDPAFAAVALVGELLGFKALPALTADIARRTDPVSAVVRASHIRERTVRLEVGWNKRDVGPLIGFLKEGMHPVVLRRKGSTYEIVNPVDGSSRLVDDTTFSELYFEARMLYAALPEKNLNGFDLLKFGATGSKQDVITLSATAIVIALLGLITPVLTGQILGNFVPRAARSEITDWSIILIAVAFLTAALSTVQNIAALRLEGRVDMNAQAGIWDRLMSLPAPFFRRTSIGSLSAAALGVNGIRNAMSGLAVQSVLSFIMGLANLGLMLYYDFVLGIVAFGVVSFAALITFRIGLAQVRVQREVNNLNSDISSTTFQLMSGITKLRVAAAEERAFAYWSSQFAKFRHRSFSARRIQNRLLVFNAGYAIIAPAAIFAYIGIARDGQFAVSTFLTFNVAFLMLLASTLQLTGTGITVLNVIPLFEQLEPILSNRPEVTSDLSDPGELGGRITVSNLTFAYEEGETPVLKNVSFSAEPGEFVALVGPSGCGKSTTLRLMLGFEKPDSGSVLFDGQDLATLDVGAVRRQCGVVLQSGQLFAGDILSNIVGSSTFTIDDAWEAVEMAGMREDIEHMPMGMNTLLSEGASTLSGGQRQRLMIARALLARPRVIFFDEATSALDNRTQSIVTESMRRLNATRIVIAHRLSTIQDADRIVVFEGGQVVQMGTYAELIAQEGLFKVLASRQIA